MDTGNEKIDLREKNLLSSQNIWNNAQDAEVIKERLSESRRSPSWRN